MWFFAIGLQQNGKLVSGQSIYLPSNAVNSSTLSPTTEMK